MAAGSRAGLIDLTKDQRGDCQVIDLTTSPSPPPQPYLTFTPLQPDHPPKTPVCIGELHVNALVLYHTRYLFSRSPGHPHEWAAVRLHPDPHSFPPTDSSFPGLGTPFPALGTPFRGSETIHLRAPTERSPTGIAVPGQEFGVLEQRVAHCIGLMLLKGVIRIEAKIRRVNPPVRTFVLLARPCSHSLFSSISCRCISSCTPQRETSKLSATIYFTIISSSNIRLRLSTTTAACVYVHISIPTVRPLESTSGAY